MTSPFSFVRPFYISLNNVFYTAVRTKDVINPLSLPFTVRRMSIFFLDSIYCFQIFHMTESSNLLYPSPEPI